MPNSAVMIGMPIASSEPNASNRITTAARIPIASLAGCVCSVNIDAAQLYLQARRVRVLGDGAHVRCKVERDVVRLLVEEDLCVRDLARVTRSGFLPAGTEIVTLTTCGCFAQFCEDRLDFVADIARIDIAGSPNLEDQVAGVALPCELVLRAR